MKRVEADFKSKRRPGRWHWTFALALAAAAGTLVVQAWRMQEELVRVRAEVAGLNAHRAAASALVKPTESPAYEPSAREMLRERSVPWPEVLATLEAVAVPGVTPTSVSFGANNERVTIELNASDYRTALAYVEALNGADRSGGEVRFALLQVKADSSSNAILVTLRAERVAVGR